MKNKNNKNNKVINAMTILAIMCSLSGCSNSAPDSSGAVTTTSGSVAAGVSSSAPTSNPISSSTTSFLSTSALQENKSSTSAVTTTAVTTTVAPVVTTTVTAKASATSTAKATTTTAIATQAASGVMYANQSANVRSGNSTSYSKIATISKNTAVTITGKCSNGWYAVTLSDGTKGYMSSSVLSSSKSTTVTTTTTTQKKSTVTTTTTTKKSSSGSSSSSTSSSSSSSSAKLTQADIDRLVAELQEYSNSLDTIGQAEYTTYRSYGTKYTTYEEYCDYEASYKTPSNSSWDGPTGFSPNRTYEEAYALMVEEIDYTYERIPDCHVVIYAKWCPNGVGCTNKFQTTDVWDIYCLR